MNKLIAVIAVTLMLCLQALAVVTNEVVAPLTYVGRSTEASGSVASGSSLGSEVSAALALPLNPGQTIFDNGAYWTPDIQPTGVLWASWPKYGYPLGNYQARHFQATFALPLGLNTVVGFSLFSPYYAAAGNVIPIDDNVYFYLNGTYIGVRGTDYGATNGPLPVPGLEIHESNGWHQDGTFGSAPVSLLHPGTNVIDIVIEERSGGGGTGPLNVMLLNEVPEPSTVTLVALGLLGILGGLRTRRSR